MKHNFLFLLLLGILLGCKKDEKPSEITINYQVGDKFTYITETSYFFNDTTSLNKDSVSHQIDTMYMEVEKDTLINGSNCLVLKRTGWWAYIQKFYVEQRNDGLYQVGELTPSSSPPVNIFGKAKLMYPNNLKLGLHWGESPDGKNRTYEVIANEKVSTSAGEFDCVLIKLNVFENDFILNVNDYIVEHTSTKGLVKYEWTSSDWINTEEKKGQQQFSFKIYRIK